MRETMDKQVTIADVVRVLEDFAPLSVQEHWDNSGLCIGDSSAPLTGILLGLDCTETLVDEAVAMGANLIVTHHPLIFQGIKRILPSDPTGAAIIKAVSAGISVYASHTPSDKVLGGVSFAMAERLGLENVEILSPEPGDSGIAGGQPQRTGLGVIGDLPQPLAPEEFIARVKAAFSLKSARCSRPVEGVISRVAMCGGSGSEFIGTSRQRGAQAYVSGDISYHHFFCPKGFMLIDIGHYESEIGIVDIFFSLLKKNFPTFAVRITEKNNNPIYYY